jgi:glycosyltransferase involved in cell wall biosynthesis
LAVTPSSFQQGFPSISAVLPVYNEASAVKRVLDILCQCELIQQIVVVDDGSTDGSAQKVVEAMDCDARIHLLTHARNLGKGQAVFSGLQSTQSDLILLLDADLWGLRVQHVEELIIGVLKDNLDMTVGIFRGGKIYSDFSHWATPWLSGQRCLWRKHLEGICWKAAEGYGLETAITVASFRKHWRCKYVIWRGVFHPPSEIHRGIFDGILNRAKMYLQIGRAFLLANLNS